MASFTRLGALCAFAISVGLLTTSPSAVAKNIVKPGLISELYALPRHSLRETIVTQSPEPIDVTVIRVPTTDYLLRVWNPGSDGETPDPNGQNVFHTVSTPGPDATSALSHSVEIPPLPLGMYQVKLVAPDRTAIQHLTVGTLGALVDRAPPKAVLMAVDLRTLRARRDVLVLEYTDRGALTFFPDRDGVLRFPYSFSDTGHRFPYAGALLVVASDGSIAGFPPNVQSYFAMHTYFDTDSRFYRPGDFVRYRFLSRERSEREYAWLFDMKSYSYSSFSQTIDNVATGSFVLPASSQTGFERNGTYFVSDPSRSRYEIQAGPLTPLISKEDLARFIVSVTRPDGAPAPGVRLRYSWNNALQPTFPLEMRAYPGNLMNPLSYGEATTDKEGNAIIEIVATKGDVALYVYDPDTQQIVATASAKARVPADAIATHGPFNDVLPGCLPLAFSAADADGRPKAGYRMHVDIGPWQSLAGPTPRPLLSRDVTTGRGGFALVRFCGGRKNLMAYAVTIRNQTINGFPAIGRLGFSDSPSFDYGTMFIAPDDPYGVASRPLQFTATGTHDGDSLVLYGTAFDSYSQVAHFVDGVARFTLTPPSDGDDFKVVSFLATRFGASAVQNNTVTIPVLPKTHLLSVSVGCVAASHKFCVNVSDWHGRRRGARLFIDVTPTTKAGVAEAVADPNTAYEKFFTPLDPEYGFASSWSGALGAPAISYLRPLPVPSTSQPWGQTIQIATPPSVSASGANPSRAILWENGVRTDSKGFARVSIVRPVPSPRLYLIHVIALAKDGSVGEGFSWPRW